MVGTTWYRRGFGYWLRRVAVSFFSIVVIGAVFALVVYGFFHLVSPVPGALRAVLDIAYCALCLVGGVWGWTRARRQVREALAAPPAAAGARTRSAAAQGAAPGRAMAGRLPALLLMPFLAPLLAWFLGLLLAAAFVRVPPAEISARRALDHP
ncbi:hypothetical protein [Streptomyces sp. NBC_01497]|uniref:hypothetical protein n=1 Tax=Streptomyces sp. NBC_01497 TaxID=2903885 RepID=UPI002E32D412|nr:hypothetical protein [Streptomyces sp. NBC_01497]